MLTTSTYGRTRAQRLGRQRGVVLIVALIVLVAMTLAGIALMRSVSTTGVIAGNLAFQQAATHSADVGVEAAIAFLEASPAESLGASILSGGGVRYLAYRQDPATNQTWDNFWANNIPAAAINTLAADGAGNTVSYVIHRMCNGEGDPITVAACSTARDAVLPPSKKGVGNSKGAGVVALTSPPEVYYRITARVSGPRNTQSYVQVVVSM